MNPWLRSKREDLLDQYDRNLKRDILKAKRNLRLNDRDLYHAGVECRRFAERFIDAIIARENPSLEQKIFKIKRGRPQKLQLAELIRFVEREKLAEGWIVAGLHEARNCGNMVHVGLQAEREAVVNALDSCQKIAEWFDNGLVRSEKPIESFESFAARKGHHLD